MTTGPHEVTSVDELQHPSLLGGGDDIGALTPRVCGNSVAVRGPQAHEVTTSTSFMILFCWEKVEEL